MPDTNTTILALVKPEVGASVDSWGPKLNTNFDTVDALFQLNGSDKVLKIANGGTGAASASAARTALGLGSLAVVNDAANDGTAYVRKSAAWAALTWADIASKPSTFTPSAHTHTHADITDFDAEVAAAITAAAAAAEASVSDYRANVANKVLTTDVVYSAAGLVALTPGTNVAVDLNAGVNFSLAMGGNYTLDNPTNAKIGQSGHIKIVQDGGGSRTLAYGTNWKWIGGTDGVLSTAGSSIDVLYYKVIDTDLIHATLAKGLA